MNDAVALQLLRKLRPVSELNILQDDASLGAYDPLAPLDVEGSAVTDRTGSGQTTQGYHPLGLPHLPHFGPLSHILS